MSLNMKESLHHNVVVIELKGDVLGGPDAASLNDRLHQLIANGHNQVVLDMSSVNFMNSSGLGMLIGGLTTVKNSGGSLKLANPGERIQSLLVITKLSSLFESHASVEEAVNSFSK